jgi:hypothetical protein
LSPHLHLIYVANVRLTFEHTFTTYLGGHLLHGRVVSIAGSPCLPLNLASMYRPIYRPPPNVYPQRQSGFCDLAFQPQMRWTTMEQMSAEGYRESGERGRKSGKPLQDITNHAGPSTTSKYPKPHNGYQAPKIPKSIRTHSSKSKKPQRPTSKNQEPSSEMVQALSLTLSPAPP